MSHEEAFELLAPLALDALDPDVRLRVDAHVETCADCRRELDELLEVATALGTTVETPPEDLWAKIASHLYEGGPRRHFAATYCSAPRSLTFAEGVAPLVGPESRSPRPCSPPPRPSSLSRSISPVRVLASPISRAPSRRAP